MKVNLWTTKVSALAVGLLLLLNAVVVMAQNLCVVRSLGEKNNDPISPGRYGLLAEGPDGSLYSTTPQGTNNLNGAVFKLTRDGQLSVLWSFAGNTQGRNKTGLAPESGLTRAKTFDGYFYGTARRGGDYGAGTLFKIKPEGGEPTMLFHFRGGNMFGLDRPCKSCNLPPPCPQCPFTERQIRDAAGSYPLAPPVFGPDGYLYGVTAYMSAGAYLSGVFYKISPNPGHVRYTNTTPPLFKENVSFKALHQFEKEGRGATNLFFSERDGCFYGTTEKGARGFEHGTVFKAMPAGGVVTLHAFNTNNIKDGQMPNNLMQGTDGNLYGTTFYGGDHSRGVVYRLALENGMKKDFTVLHHFTGVGDEGGSPMAGLVEKDCFLYGATRGGVGAAQHGSLYRISPDGKTFEVLYMFPTTVENLAGYRPMGNTPFGTPMLHTDGNVYGTTGFGGAYNRGVVYRLIPRLEFAGGQTAYDDNVVQVQTGVAVSQGVRDAGDNDAITIKVKCYNSHFVQFLYREAFDAKGQRVGGTYAVRDPQDKRMQLCAICKTKEGFNCTMLAKPPPTGDCGDGKYECYERTTNPDVSKDYTKAAWRTDSRRKPSPYYDSPATSRRECDSLTIFDTPNFDKNPNYKLQRATFKTYVICNGTAVKEVNWVREMDWAPDKNGVPAPRYRYTKVEVKAPNAAEFEYLKELSEAKDFEWDDVRVP